MFIRFHYKNNSLNNKVEYTIVSATKGFYFPYTQLPLWFTKVILSYHAYDELKQYTPENGPELSLLSNKC